MIFYDCLHKKIALAGILVEKEHLVQEAYAPHCSLLRRKIEGDWVSLWLRKISGADMRRFYHPHLPSIGQKIILDEKGSHHLLRVTGISKNEEVEIFDGKGPSLHCYFTGGEKKSAVLELIKERDVLVKIDIEYWLLVALVRPDPFQIFYEWRQR